MAGAVREGRKGGRQGALREGEKGGRQGAGRKGGRGAVSAAGKWVAGGGKGRKQEAARE